MGIGRYLYKGFSYVKDIDMYGKRIAFTYRGKEQYKTYLGGIITIMVVVVMILYAQIMFRVLIEKTDTGKSTNGLIRNLISDSDSLDLSTTDFYFAFTMDNDTFDIITDQSYINLDITQYNITGGSAGVITNKGVSIARCGSDYFKFEEQSSVNTFGISEYICPVSTNFTLKGNVYAPIYEYFELNIYK